jgi:predicted transcriptional regulator
MTIESPIDQLSNTTMKAFNNQPNGTQSSQLLAAAAAQGGSTLLPDCGDESLGPDRNAVDLLKALKVGDTTGKELTIDERRLVVKSMKELGQTQDAIADLLKVSRRTIVNDYKVLRQEQALAIAKTDTHEIAGEVYTTAKTCIRRALAAGSFKTVSVIMRDMVELLQSLGILYRAPKTSMQATGHFDIPGRNKGYQKYMNGIGEDKTKVVEVLDCMFSAIDNNELSDHS